MTMRQEALDWLQAKSFTWQEITSYWIDLTTVHEPERRGVNG